LPAILFNRRLLFPPRIPQTNHNEIAFMTTLLITGVTGFLGGAALEKILHQKTG
jgi:hypothetical protein